MNDLLPDPTTVQAPEHALEWAPSRGFVADLEELTEAHGEGELTLLVEDSASLMDWVRTRRPGPTPPTA